MSETAYISIDDHEGFNKNKKLNLNLTVLFLAFSMMLFHFTMVYFFTIQLESIALVGLFLGFGNLFAFLFDIPIGILQYHFKYKTLLITSVVAQILAMAIFANFIFGVTAFITDPAISLGGGEESIVGGILSFFLTSGLNLVFLLFASVLYGFSRELQDITLLSYVLNNANPSQYKTIIAQKNLFYGIGSFIGLLISGFILTFAPNVIVINVIFIILIITFITFKFFDNDSKVVDIENFKVYFDKDGISKTKDNAIQTIKNIDLNKTLSKTKYIFMKPIVKNHKKIKINELIVKTKISFRDILDTIIYAKNFSLVVYWSFSMVLIFGFWDTFASTFLIDYLNDLKNGWSYILLGIIAIPAFGLQEYFGKLADRVGIYFIANIGLAISGLSLFFLTFFSVESNFIIIMFLALANSVGYAICMGLSQGIFLESYNKVYAEKNKLTKIDSNASAAPMKILQNLANVFGLVFGSLILWLFGYSGFFFVFGSLILIFLWWSLKRKTSLKI